MLIGYARVSTRDQETHLQLDALKKAGVEVVYQEKASAVSVRPELQRVLSTLKAGDVLVVYKMDRVARSLKDLLSILESVSASGAAIRSLTEPLDTSVPVGIFMVQVLGAVAQLERSIIRERTVAGQVSAIKRGVQFGRPKLLSPEREAELLALVDSGVNQSAAAREFGVSLIVVRRLVDERNGRKNTGRYPVLRKYLDL
ncbi:recombinase family protein [Simplicispira metamorpha]|uniref:DNA invertase Pin-like site-specific DNA recombinase n=1 Tax=Simplicispira metamorpha TaxID=80881 RepID=A0A4R2NAU3_9BURK|nr:recombinase family protein [Simplicispira metamorpha]TCP18249.1 DNA invertase Pin-like site-specific DNA recombinase [Simplicispira metamorpha]